MLRPDQRHQPAAEAERQHGPERADRAVEPDAHAGALSVAIGVGRVSQVDHAVGAAPHQPRDEQQHEPGREPVGERGEGARRACRGGQRVGADPARERRDPAITDDADHPVDRKQDRDRRDLNAERSRVERQHHIDQRIAQPDEAKARRRDHGLGIAFRAPGKPHVPPQPTALPGRNHSAAWPPEPGETA
jgi:hypothetical protein